MNNLEAAFRALDFVRSHVNVGFHSPNKKLLGLSPVRPDERAMAGEVWTRGEDRLSTPEAIRRANYGNKRQQAGVDLNILRNLGPGIRGKTWNNVLSYGKIITEKGVLDDRGRKLIGVGNCSDLACAAAYFLVMKLKMNQVDIVTAEGQDHAFVVVGQVLPSDGKYPNNFHSWSLNAAICDPWGDIACEAIKFRENWQARMRNWASIKLGFVGDRMYMGNEQGMLTLIDGPKKSFIPPSAGRSRPYWV